MPSISILTACPVHMILVLMFQRSLVLLLVLSWITLSGMDALEDLDFDSHTTRDVGAAAGWPPASKPAKLANDIVELAHGNPLYLATIVKHLDRENTAKQTFLNVSPISKAAKIHQERCVLII
jgi:hypothetical protein